MASAVLSPDRPAGALELDGRAAEMENHQRQHRRHRHDADDEPGWSAREMRARNMPTTAPTTPTTPSKIVHEPTTAAVPSADAAERDAISTTVR